MRIHLWIKSLLYGSYSFKFDKYINKEQFIQHIDKNFLSNIYREGSLFYAVIKDLEWPLESEIPMFKSYAFSRSNSWVMFGVEKD